MFLARSASLRLRPILLTASTVIEVICTACTWYSDRLPSSIGLAAYPTLVRLRLVNSSVSTMTMPPRGRSPMLAFRAAGFIATSTVGASPGVTIEWSAKCTWNADTPGIVPAGARISAGKSGSVDRLLPNAAVSTVNRSPVSCIPSPESPANRMTTSVRVWTGFAAVCLVMGTLAWLCSSLGGSSLGGSSLGGSSLGGSSLGGSSRGGSSLGGSSLGGVPLVPPLDTVCRDGRRRRLGGDHHPPGTPSACLLYTSPSPRDRTRSRMP